MFVSGQILDASTKQPIPAASIVVVDAHNMNTGQGVAADDGGYFVLSSPVLDNGGALVVSAVDYQSVITDPSLVVETNEVELHRSGATLPTAVVTAKAPAKNAAIPILLGGGLLLALASDKKKKGKMSGVGVDWTRIAIAGGVLVGGYFLVVKPLFQSLGILDKPSPTDTATSDAQQKSLADAKAAAASQGKQGQTYPDSQYQNWANEIERLGPNQDQSGILNIVDQVNTLVDWLMLVNAWGIRKEGGFMCANFNVYCTSYDLPSYLREVLDAAHINNLNLYFTEQGINYQL